MDNKLEKQKLAAAGSIWSSPVTRRTLLGRLGASTAAAAAAAGIQPSAAIASEESEPGDELSGVVDGKARRSRAFHNRVKAAIEEREIPVPRQDSNGDEARYATRIGNFSKGLPHNSRGEVDPVAYGRLLTAVTSGDPNDFANVPLGGAAKLANPQGGLGFGLEGTDSGQLTVPRAPPLASAERAGEMVEDYWMALLRDVPFSRYGSDALVAAAVADLNRLSDFAGPRAQGRVAPETLFRGSTAGDTIGPYVSQFLLLQMRFGQLTNPQRYNTYVPGLDYLTDFDSWLACQNGRPSGQNVLAAKTSYIKNGRDLAAYDHLDFTAQASLTALFWLLQHNFALSVRNPYRGSLNQGGGPTFGNQHILALLYQVAIVALRAVTYQKWFVHRALRPEAFGGLVHDVMTGKANHPLHGEVLNSDAAGRVFSKYGSYLLPHADPEGCPQHPAYPAAHAVSAGATATVLKAFFDESVVMPNPMVASDDGQSLLPYTGSDAGQMTVGGELNKLASNISLGRDIEGVHWRSDGWQGMLLGEVAAISVLRDQQRNFNEPFLGFTFTKFDGTTYPPPDAR